MAKILSLCVSAVLALISYSAFAQGTMPSDAEIAGIVVAANTIDIDAGKVAQSKASKKEVKEFAERMITDHTGSNKQATALVKKLKVKPEDSDASKALKEGGKENLAKLKGLKG